MSIAPDPRAALYARVSPGRSAQEGSIASQVAALRQRISADGCAVTEPMCFLDDGQSGATLLRPALERLRDQAAAGALDRRRRRAPRGPPAPPLCLLTGSLV